MPGVGLKLLIDGSQSQNFHLMNNLEGQGPDRNWFLKGVSNVYPNPTSFAIKAIGKIFDAGVAMLPGGLNDRPETANTLGLYEQASVTSDGKAVAKVVAPWKIQLVPNQQVLDWQKTHNAALDPSAAPEDFRTFLGAIPTGSAIYDVMAQRSQDAKADYIGRLVTRSQFVASKYGDEKLYLQHAHKRWQA